MSPRCWRYACLFGGALWLIIVLGIWGCSTATAAPLSDAPTFLARYGIVAPMPPIRVVDSIPSRYVSLNAPAQQAQANAGEVILDTSPLGVQSDPRMIASTVLHEALHYASFWRWREESPNLNEDEQWMMRYEEGLVEATTESLSRNWWRYLTGRRLSQWWDGSTMYEPLARWWKALAQKATGESWRSRSGREWLIGAINLDPAERVALAARVNAGMQ